MQLQLCEQLLTTYRCRGRCVRSECAAISPQSSRGSLVLMHDAHIDSADVCAYELQVHRGVANSMQQVSSGRRQDTSVSDSTVSIAQDSL
jgi:hypothetical protein